MPTQDEIREIKEHYVNALYTQVRKEQKEDKKYIEDTFEVPEVHDPHQLYRSGIGDRIVNAPAEHIVTANPQVFFYPRKETKAGQESALKLSALINEHWLPLLKRQNPNIFKEFIKNMLGRGEAFFKVTHNPNWTSKVLPVNFIVPDSMVVYASPEEDIDGVPEKVVIFYDISQFKDLIPRYPILKGIISASQMGEMVQWLEYYDSEARYVEVSKTPLTKDGVQKNVYGFTPVVRKYSGFGRRSPDGELASLIVSDIRRSRDLVREECATRSNIASIEYLFAHKPFTFIGKGLSADELRESISYGAYDINAVDAEPNQVRIEKFDIVPSPETYKHHSDIMTELNQRHPFILAGFPWGSSGRQQDIVELSAMRRYDSVVENAENAFATAIGMALKICLIPGFKPDGISEKDLKTEFDIEVRLKAKDPIEEERRITMGGRLWNGGKGSISLGKFHTEYLGLTADESKREIARMLADQITIYNPDVAAVMGMVAAEETGMADWLEKARMRSQQLEQGKGVREPLPATGEQRVQGETQTPMGFEEATSRGARSAPSAYNRGG